MTIAEFLLALATDPERLERFRDPDQRESVIREAELDEAQSALLLAGDLVDLRVKIEAEFNVSGEEAAIIWIYGLHHPST